MSKVYLGDGVYAEPWHGGVQLTVEDGREVVQVIYLEPEVLAALDKFRTRCAGHDALDGSAPCSCGAWHEKCGGTGILLDCNGEAMRYACDCVREEPEPTPPADAVAFTDDPMASPSEWPNPKMERCDSCGLDFTEGGYKAHRESEFSGCAEPGWLARTPAGTHQTACDFDPLAVHANWDDSTDIACKVAAAAMAYARRTPDAVAVARDANANAMSILRRGCAEIDGCPVDKQSPCPEDVVMWALTYITRLLAAEAEREAGREGEA